MNRQNVFDYAKKKYGTEPDYPWSDNAAVLRHGDNGKWYGLVMEVRRDKLGLSGGGMIKFSRQSGRCRLLPGRP